MKKQLTKEQFRQMAFPIVDGKNVIPAKMELSPNNIGTINGNGYKIEIKAYEDEVVLIKVDE